MRETNLGVISGKMTDYFKSIDKDSLSSVTSSANPDDIIFNGLNSIVTDAQLMSNLLTKLDKIHDNRIFRKITGHGGRGEIDPSANEYKKLISNINEIKESNLSAPNINLKIDKVLEQAAELNKAKKERFNLLLLQRDFINPAVYELDDKANTAKATIDTIIRILKGKPKTAEITAQITELSEERKLLAKNLIDLDKSRVGLVGIFKYYVSKGSRHDIDMHNKRLTAVLENFERIAAISIKVERIGHDDSIWTKREITARKMLIKSCKILQQVAKLAIIVAAVMLTVYAIIALAPLPLGIISAYTATVNFVASHSLVSSIVSAVGGFAKGTISDLIYKEIGWSRTKGLKSWPHILEELNLYDPDTPRPRP